MSVPPLVLSSRSASLTCRSLAWTQCRGMKKITYRIEDPYADKKAAYADYEPKKISGKRQAYAWGFAASGALGIKTYLQPDNIKFPNAKPRPHQPFPARVRFFHGYHVRDVAAGHGFSLFAATTSKSSHTLYGTGVNTYNQIGWQEHGGNRMTVLIEPVPIHVPISSDQRIEKVAAGRCHSLVLANPGSDVYSFGMNACGQLGRRILEGEDYTKCSFVHRVPIPEEVIDIVCGQDHSLFLTKSGSVYACGLGADGQTGLGHYQNQADPVKVAGDLENENIIQVSSCADSSLAVSGESVLISCLLFFHVLNSFSSSDRQRRCFRVGKLRVSAI